MKTKTMTSSTTTRAGPVTEPDVLAARIEAILPKGLTTQKKMFGGVTFLANGNMLCCATRKGLMVRVGADGEKEALASPFVGPCLGAGRRMAGFLMVEPRGIESATDLESWLARARRYVERLPAKEAAAGEGASKKRKKPGARRSS